jgi:hypothetical protein
MRCVPLFFTVFVRRAAGQMGVVVVVVVCGFFLGRVFVEALGRGCGGGGV